MASGGGGGGLTTASLATAISGAANVLYSALTDNLVFPLVRAAGANLTLVRTSLAELRHAIIQKVFVIPALVASNIVGDLLFKYGPQGGLYVLSDDAGGGARTNNSHIVNITSARGVTHDARIVDDIIGCLLYTSPSPRD